MQNTIQIIALYAQLQTPAYTSTLDGISFWVFLFPLAAHTAKCFLMLLVPHLQPVVVSCNQEHYGAFFGCRMTLYIQRVLIQPPQMCNM